MAFLHRVRAVLARVPLGAGQADRSFRSHLRSCARVAVLRDPMPGSKLDVESATLRSLEHPHLLRILDAGAEHGRTFVVTELVSGGALDEVRKPLAPDVLQALASQMLEALAFLHAQRILHGDVKTENILTASLVPPHFKLADFGLAQSKSIPAGKLFAASSKFSASVNYLFSLEPAVG